MAISSIQGSNQNVSASANGVSAKSANTVGADAKQTTVANGEAAVYEKSAPQSESVKTYKRDTATLSEISQQVELKMASLKSTVENLFSTQSLKFGESKGLSYDRILEKYDGKLKEFYQNLEVDESTRLKAQKEIAEDGFWGVKQTSERAIAFAKALSGGDPSQVELLKKAIEDGYAAAEKAWGGELPEISKLTQEATLKGLDDWAREAAQTA